MAGNPKRIRRPSDRTGAAAVEFAMTAPILFILLFAALELGRMNLVRHTANNAAYEAARACVVPGATATDGEAVGLAVLQTVGIQGATVDVKPDTIANDTPQVTATVTIPFNNNTWYQTAFSKDKSVTVSCVMVRDWVVSTRQ